MSGKIGESRKSRLGHCGKAGYKHCPAAICILYEIGGMSTSAIMKEYGVSNGAIDKLKKKGRLHVRHEHRQVCEASILILYAMTGLECSICGELCDPDDKRWGYSGPLHPSLDHVVARANGGADTPDNYRLAHVICNSVKGDRELTDEIRAEAVAAVSGYATKEAC